MELLAPAGNMECLKTAVAFGADAVYFAGKQFGARSFADNFSDEEVYEAAEYCRLRGVKTYLTVNTMTTDRELLELERFLGVLADAGVDGVIVQDLGVLRRIKQVCPQMPVHGSTQMTVHNLAGVRELERLGVSRVVLSRELSKIDMQAILRNCEAEIEVFVHGAMCMSYSGQCLMSSVLGGRSGNRGKCAQPCRLAYHSGDGREKNYLSLLDMSLANHLGELKQMGVASLKIEGRMKGPDYIRAVVGTYRRCIDEMRKPTGLEETQMNRVFFRGGLTDGYFIGETGPAMFAFDKPDNPYAKQNGEQPDPPGEREGILTECHLVLTEGEIPVITTTAMGKTVTCQGDTALERAQKSAPDKEAIRRQLAKTGGTGFVMTDISLEITGMPFVPIKTVNALRREGINALTKEISKAAKKEFSPQPLLINLHKEGKKMQFTASVYTKEQFDAVRDFPFVKIDLPLHLVTVEPDYYLADRERILLTPSVILPDGEYPKTMEAVKGLQKMGFTGLRAENIGSFSLGEGMQIWGGHRLNLANHLALQEIRGLGAETACLSAELNLAQIRDLQGELPTEVLGYGHLPLMVTENCVRKNMEQCPCDGVGVLVDRKGKKFPVIKDGNACRSVVLNTVPLFMGDKLDELRNGRIDYCRLLFTVESAEETEAVCRTYFAGEEYPGEFTRLHYYKGVK
ncbi:MAG: U32 family peptidase [Clostridia bacterium]|nr:U32 family peptidase [Clostridia bacterium]